MATFEYHNLSACHDCVHAVANGEYPEDRPDLGAEIEGMWPPGQDENGDEPFWLCVGHHVDEDDEDYDEDEDDNIDLGFSRSSCDTCGSTLGGDRYKVCAYRWRYTDLEKLARAVRPS